MCGDWDEVGGGFCEDLSVIVFRWGYIWFV